MNKSIKTGDTVKIIAGEAKGKEGKIVKIDRKASKACVEGIGVRTRHLKKTQFNPAGGKKEIHVGIDLSNLKVTASAKKEAKPAAAKKPAAKKSAKKETK